MLDTNDAVDAFVKNGDSGFIPHMHNGQPHDYVPDFIVRIRCDSPLHLIVETKGFDGWRGQGRRGRAMGCRGQRGRTFGTWRYAMVRGAGDEASVLDAAASVRTT